MVSEFVRSLMTPGDRFAFFVMIFLLLASFYIQYAGRNSLDCFWPSNWPQAWIDAARKFCRLANLVTFAPGLAAIPRELSQQRLLATAILPALEYAYLPHRAAFTFMFASNVFKILLASCCSAKLRLVGKLNAVEHRYYGDAIDSEKAKLYADFIPKFLLSDHLSCWLPCLFTFFKLLDLLWCYVGLQIFSSYARVNVVALLWTFLVKIHRYIWIVDYSAAPAFAPPDEFNQSFPSAGMFCYVAEMSSALSNTSVECLANSQAKVGSTFCLGALLLLAAMAFHAFELLQFHWQLRSPRAYLRHLIVGAGVVYSDSVWAKVKRDFAWILALTGGQTTDACIVLEVLKLSVSGGAGDPENAGWHNTLDNGDAGAGASGGDARFTTHTSPNYAGLSFDRLMLIADARLRSEKKARKRAAAQRFGGGVSRALRALQKKVGRPTVSRATAAPVAESSGGDGADFFEIA